MSLDFNAASKPKKERTKKPTLADRLEAFFRANPMKWIDGDNLRFAGRYAWRTQVSYIRLHRGMNIENRQRAIKNDVGETAYVVSEYRYVPAGTSSEGE